MIRILAACALAICLSNLAHAGGIITSGQASYQFLDAGSGSYYDNLGPATFHPRSGATPTQLRQAFWALNPFGLSQNETATFTPVSYSGDTATFNVDYAGSASTGSNLVVKIVGGPQDGQATVTQTLTLYNNSNNSAQPMRVFFYADPEAGGTASGNSSTLTGGNTVHVASGGDTFDFSAVNPSKYEARPFSSTETAGNDLRYDLMAFPAYRLSGTGLPLVGDVVGAFEWDFALPSGTHNSVTSSFTITPTPEPGCVLVAAVFVIGWRRGHRGKSR